MRANLKKILIWLGLSILMLIFWIIGILIGNALFPSSLMDASAESNGDGTGILFLTCLMNTGVILYFIHKAQFKAWKLAGTLFLIAFGIQWLMSQIETLWFNDSLSLPINGIWAIISGGVIMTLLFSLVATWLTGSFRPSEETSAEKLKIDLKPLLRKVIFFSVVVWPLIYFLAGYLVAWQFAEVRLLYSGTTDMASFASIMNVNIVSGLYFFQIFRGLLWVLIGLLVIAATKGPWIEKGIILGLLFSILGSSQLLLPNPIMPEMVRMAHLLETVTSNFLWGFLIAWYFGNHVQYHRIAHP